jgi:putative ABC transport system permease protein
MPEWTTHLRPRLARLRLTPAREAEIIEELSQHLDERYDELRRNGMADAEATRLALDELQDPEALASQMRPLKQANIPEPVTHGAPRGSFIQGFSQDIRYAFRTMRKAPGFTAAVVVTLALGIGVNSAIFALVDATLLRPLPFPTADRLVVLFERSEANARGRVSPLNLADWHERNRTFETMGGFVPAVGGMVMGTTHGLPDTVPRQWVTARYFDALGVKPVAGRLFQQSDDTPQGSVVVLSESCWRTRFGADPSVIGTQIHLDGDPWTIVGVAPDDAQVLQTDIWAMIPITGAPPPVRGQYFFNVVGRMKPGVDVDAARSDLAAVAAGLAGEFPKTNAGRSVTLEPMRDYVIGGDLRQTSALFLGVVGIVLFICCANIANLLLTRATVRTRELALRSALGADRSRVFRQLLTESLVLSVIGGALGLAVGSAIIQAAPSLIPPGLLPSSVSLTFDLRVVAFCAVTAILVGLLFGLAPAWQATGIASAPALGSDTRTTTGRGGRLRSVLVAGEVATAVLLLVGAGLLLRTLLAVEGVDRGYRADRVLTMIVDPMGSRYPTDEAELRFYKAVEDEVKTLPAVRGVAWATTLPLGRSYEGNQFFEIVGDAQRPASQRPSADYQIVSPAYFSTLEIPIVAGRAFDDRDVPGNVPVCIVNEAFVRDHLQGRSPVGVKIAIRASGAADAQAVVREIVGVARQVKGRPDEREDLLQIYVPMAQDTPGDVYMLVRAASGDAQALGPSVRAALARIDKEQLVSVRDLMTLDEIAATATARHRFRAVLALTFAGLALMLAMVGLFGVLAYSVQQRVREFGVRRALGATAQDVFRTVASSAARVITAGAVVGGVLSIVLGQFISTMLFGVEPLDPLTFALVALVVGVTAAIATAAPAWRATRVDPVIALRAE